MPVCFVLASDDTVISNETVIGASDGATHPLSELSVVEGARHCNINFDEEYLA